MINITYLIVQIIVVIAIAPLVNGIIKKIKALSQKRKGAPILQLYYDLYKLLKKDTVVSDTTSWIFKAAPYIVFTSSLVAAMLVPVTTMLDPIWLAGDLILMVYLLALGRFFMMLAGLDAASTFGGMGASREAMISSLIEPSILVSLITVGLTAGSTSSYQIMEYMKYVDTPLIRPVYFMAFIALFIVTIAETARIPVDDPSTHLELTMVHEAMLLEYSGRGLALMELGASIKQLTFITLLANIFIPHDQLILISGVGAVVLSVLIYVIKIVFISILIAVAEVSTVKLRLFSIPNIAALAFILSFIGFMQYFVLGR
ncbi:MAG: NADH-quinone oxidoreductase subunit H [Eubacteriales bacterium]|nr:NADH-quinone oxidoreductase subunit H [Eubacteriales bacterium]MDD3198719.1 NADH-quinone oxidoreductase subunit H [Eubacteriales bacterium]MDD4122397.1 NADH-quinone oxidoreductase subunit H [Eubacteriales bacterium]MDD4629035.1 NADH-quinone oxidoreductase subunit H [Eubacteriales bacterium]